MYAGVPPYASPPSISSRSPASPKSLMRTCPRPSIMMLAGFRSRCSTPTLCAAVRPAQSWRAIWSAFSSAGRPMRLSRDCRFSPSMYSIEKKWCPSTSPVSYTRHTLQCDTCRATRTSPPQTLQRSRVRSHVRRQELQRDRNAELHVIGAVYLPHPPAPQHLDDAIAFPQQRPGQKPPARRALGLPRQHGRGERRALRRRHTFLILATRSHRPPRQTMCPEL